MPVVVPVKFPYASKDLWFDPEGLDIAQADYAVVYTERGTEIGLVTEDPFEVPASRLAAPLKSVIRIADDADLDRADELARKGQGAGPAAQLLQDLGRVRAPDVLPALRVRGVQRLQEPCTKEEDAHRHPAWQGAHRGVQHPA